MIEVSDLVKRHGAIEVLRGVNLSVERGEVAAIIGPSGSGKSTFLRCLNGLERFQAGRVTIDGLRFGADGVTPAAEWNRVQRQVCRRVGMVFQSFNLFPHRTALENVMEGPIYVLGLDRDGAESRAAVCWTESACRTGSRRCRVSSRAVSSNGSRSPAPWRWSRKPCSSTSRPARSIPE